MTTLIKIILATILSLSLFSCNFNLGEHGNGKVITENRPLNTPFKSIEVSEGLSVYLTPSAHESISVEADENLQDLIITEVENSVLRIHTKENIASYTSKKVVVYFKNINRIKASSGSLINATTPLVTKDLNIETSSGGTVNLNVNTANLDCKSSSGSNLVISGKTLNFTAEASSGSSINATDLTAEISNVKTSSGANISVNTSKKITAEATSGSQINYLGNPEVLNKTTGSSGSIEKK